MSVVAIPFSDEPAEVVLRNIAVAAGHGRVDEVWAVGESREVSEGARTTSSATGKKIDVFPEDRLGDKRPGKGDAINTALRRAAAEAVGRLHFYDADISNFDADWIEGAERGADRGFEVVRHTFPRASTDAMITWFVTKPMFAMRFPGTILPKIGQPLGGELLLTYRAVQALAAEPSILARSDWGIDTVLTHGVVAAGFSLYEHHIAAGKRHALYGSLEELRTMVVECFDAVNSLSGEPIGDIRHDRDPDSPVPDDLKRQQAYSVERSTRLLTSPVTKAELDRIESLPGTLPAMTLAMASTGNSDFLDEVAWWDFLGAARTQFVAGDAGWESLLFRMWAGRVLNYTVQRTGDGYDAAMGYLEETIRVYERFAR